MTHGTVSDLSLGCPGRKRAGRAGGGRWVRTGKRCGRWASTKPAGGLGFASPHHLRPTGSVAYGVICASCTALISGLEEWALGRRCRELAIGGRSTATHGPGPAFEPHNLAPLLPRLPKFSSVPPRPQLSLRTRPGLVTHRRRHNLLDCNCCNLSFFAVCSWIRCARLQHGPEPAE